MVMHSLLCHLGAGMTTSLHRSQESKNDFFKGGGGGSYYVSIFKSFLSIT